jgi:hypothetical protein
MPALRFTAAVAALLATSPAFAGDTLEKAIGAPDWLAVDLTHRTRYEALHSQPVSTRRGDDQLLSLVTFLKIEAGGDHVKLVGELVDARGYLDDSGSGFSNGTVDPFDVLQLHLAFKDEDFLLDGDKARLQAGRFIASFGANRLIGKNQFRNVSDAFTGLRFDWTAPKGETLTLMYALPVQRLPNDALGLSENQTRFDDQDFDLQLWNVYFVKPKAIFGLNAEAYVIGLREFDDPLEAQTRNRRLVTPGVRLVSKPEPGAFDLELEGALQFGKARATASAADTRDLNVSAGFVHAGLGYTFDAPWKPRLIAEYEFASGDNSPTDGGFNRFDTLFPALRGDLGPGSLYAILNRANISSPGVRLEAQPTDKFDFFIDQRVVFLDSARDRFGNTGVVDAAGNSGRYAGAQTEARARYWLKKNHIRLEAGGAYFHEGRFMRDAPNENGEGDVVYGYFDVTFTY